MDRFVLIDRNLSEMGGHHFQYAVDVLETAEAVGYEPVLAVHRRFNELNSLPAHWRVLPTFAYEWKARHWLQPLGKRDHVLTCDGHDLRAADEGLAKRRGLRSWLSSAMDLPQVLKRLDCERQIKDFAGGCARILSHLALGCGDAVFFPSMVEFDLVGLVRFLRDAPGTREIGWHVQFHFDVFRGRIPDYAGQAQVAAVQREQLACLLNEIPDHRLFFYATSETIADQFNRLKVADFQPLPFPVNRRIGPSDVLEDSGRRPLRITCAGSWRREKGKRAVSRVIEELWPDYLASGRAQLIFQGGRRDLRRHVPSRFRASARICDSATVPAEVPIAIVRHPLPVEEYSRLIREADIGLFLYNSERYFARCSGVLVEMLAAGIPVVVPAACWLADQIAQPLADHLAALHDSLPVVDRICPAAEAWESSLPKAGAAAGQVSFGGPQAAASADFSIPHGARFAFLRFRQSGSEGVYVRARCSIAEESGEHSGGGHVAITGGNELRHRSCVVVPLLRGGRLCLRLENAFHDSRVDLHDCQITFHAAPAGTAEGVPLGRVGLIASDVSQFASSTTQIIQHYEHYRESARQFSKSWRHNHDAMRTVERIQQNNRQAGITGHCRRAG